MSRTPLKLLALDFGVKKMGLATGSTLEATSKMAAADPSRVSSQPARPNSENLHITQPLCILSMDNGTPNWVQLIAQITDQSPDLILVGLPLNMDGSDSHLSKRAHKFARRLSHQLKAAHQPVPVALIDERLSSAEARSINQARGQSTRRIDAQAAELLIQSYFNEPDQLIEL